jgi:hypothetical protein
VGADVGAEEGELRQVGAGVLRVLQEERGAGHRGEGTGEVWAGEARCWWGWAGVQKVGGEAGVRPGGEGVGEEPFDTAYGA